MKYFLTYTISFTDPLAVSPLNIFSSFVNPDRFNCSSLIYDKLKYSVFICLCTLMELKSNF